MKWLKRILIAIPVVIILLIGAVFLVNFLTPKPVSLLARGMFDNSDKEVVYNRPDDFEKQVSQLTISKDITYQSNNKNNTMDIYAPKEISAKNGIIFWVHGGAYVGGDKGDCQDYLEMISSATNQIVVNINYDLAPETKHPVPVLQLNEAIQAIEEQYPDQVDWNKVTIGGDSAGAQISSEYLLALQNKNIQQEIKLKPALSNDQVKKFVSLSGLLVPAKFGDVEDNISHFLYEKCGWAYFDSKKFEKDPLVMSLAIEEQTNNWTQEVFLTDGNTNTFTSQMESLATTLQKAKIPVTVVSYQKKEASLPHEYQFDFSTKQAQETYQQLVTFLSE
jgi:acetyl esterase